MSHDRISEIDRHYTITGFHEQREDDSLTPLRGFVRSPFAPLIYHCTKKAADIAKLETIEADRIGIASGSLFADTLTEQEASRDLFNGEKLSPVTFPQSVPCSIIGFLARDIGINGPMTCTSVIRGGLLNLLEQASDWMQQSRCDAVVVNFGDTPSLRSQRWFDSHLPFCEDDANRSFEACAVGFVIEPKDKAAQRGAPSIYSVREFYDAMEKLPQPFVQDIQWLRSENLLKQLLQNNSNDIALHYADTTVRFCELKSAVDAKASTLTKKSVNKQRVAIDLPDSFTLLEWVLACWSARNSVLILDPRLSTHEKAQRLETFSPNVTIIEQPSTSANENIRHHFIPSVNSQLIFSEKQTSYDDNTEKPSLVLFSSGSSGKQKLITRNYRNLNDEWYNYQTEPGAPSKDSCVLCLVPISHAYGLQAAVLHTLIQGGSVVFPETIQARNILDHLTVKGKRNKYITHTYGVPFHFQMLYSEFEKRKDELPASPVLVSAGSKLDINLCKKYQELDLPIGQQYGMSETGYIAVDFYGKKSGSCGPVAQHIQYHIANNELHIELPNSPYTSKQLNWSDHSDSTYGGILKTQDLVEIDDEEHIFIQGRSGDQVSIGGLKTSLTEIEQALKKHKKIKDACVVSHEHPVVGNWLEGFVVCETEQLHSNEIQEWLYGLLARYKVPRKITNVGEIPRSGVGKVSKAKLLEMTEA